MKIRKIKITNFKGIRELEWVLPENSLLCIIGKGDSTKSTILEAIRFCFYPHWNLTLNDTDFFMCNISNPIEVNIVLGELPDKFSSIDEYGLFLFGWDSKNKKVYSRIADEFEEVLLLRFSVNDSLEPSWEVLDHELNHGKNFGQNDRQKVNVNLIGNYSDRHLTWGKGSVLLQLSDLDKNNMLFAETSRSTLKLFDNHRNDSLQQFDDIAKKAEEIAKNLGVSVKETYKTQLDLSSFQLNQGGLSIHEGNIPLKQLGLGSRRMVICGLQKESISNSHITLFDEVEMGLEPHRIARLLKYIKEDVSGQYFLTTHSPVVLRELTIDELFIVHNIKGNISITPAKIDDDKGGIQGKIRSFAESFLAEKIIVCEGQTEVGFLRGLDNYWVSKGKFSFSYQGVALLSAGGVSNIYNIAENLNDLQYKVCVLVDGDAQDSFSKAHADKLREKNIEVIMWDDGIALEQQIISDLSWENVKKSVCFARDNFDKNVIQNISSQIAGGITDDVLSWEDSPALREMIGKAAKSSGWFKSISKSESWVEVISDTFTDPKFNSTELVKKIRILRGWVDHE